MAITVELIKSTLYLNIVVDEFDASISRLISDISHQAIEYMENDDIVSVSDFTETIERKLCAQIAYEFRMRENSGLKTIIHPDGTMHRYSVDEWLPDVKQVLDKHRIITIG